MMVDAKIVFLDEVGAGVNRTLLNTIGDAILRLNKERGYTFCMIEHDMDFIGRLCDPVIVHGRGPRAGRGHDRRDQGQRAGDRGLSRHRPEEQGQAAGDGRVSAIPTRTTAATRTARSPARAAASCNPPRHEGECTPAEAFLIGDTMSGGYGAGPDILHDCTIAVNPGEIAVIVGPNGAGKSTAMKAVFGMLNVRKGSVRLDGEDITDLSPQARVLKGMGFVPQTSNIFPR
jgi:ABC-type branched-subunit amino acid transport system ATPase component